MKRAYFVVLMMAITSLFLSECFADLKDAQTKYLSASAAFSHSNIPQVKTLLLQSLDELHQEHIDNIIEAADYDLLSMVALEENQTEPATGYALKGMSVSEQLTGKVSPQYALALHSYGIVLLYQNKFAQAEETLNQAVQIFPPDGPPFKTILQSYCTALIAQKKSSADDCIERYMTYQLPADKRNQRAHIIILDGLESHIGDSYLKSGNTKAATSFYKDVEDNYTKSQNYHANNEPEGATVIHTPTPLELSAMNNLYKIYLDTHQTALASQLKDKLDQFQSLK